MTLATSFSDKTTKISSDNLGPKAQAFWQQLSSQGLEVHMGMTTEVAKQILAMSGEPAIREYCPKDLSERFRNQAAAEKWLAKGRAFFMLYKRSGDRLVPLGYGWTGPAASQQVPAGQTTFALRIAEAGHGQGLAAPFSWVVIAVSAQLYGLEDFWLETWASNGAAVHIYHKLGFEDVTEVPSQRPRPSGESVQDTRIYMDLANQLLTE